MASTIDNKIITMSDLTGKVALITGAGHPKGIGRAIAKQLIRAGATVIISDLHDNEQLRTGVSELENLGGEAAAAVCDVSSKASFEQALAFVLESYKQLDILVNNAGVAVGDEDFLAIAESDWQMSTQVNLMGVVNGCQTVIPLFKQQGCGSIINIASLAGLGAIEGIPANYTATKFAVVGLTKQLALQYGDANIRINAVCPGSVVTQMHELVLQSIAESNGVSLKQAQKIENSSIPLGYSANPETIGDAVVFLASDKASYITGQALPIAGGMAPGL